MADADRLPAALARRIATLAADLTRRLPAHPRPSLLHGDLWGGNVVVDGDRVSALIDPACYHGHGEVDLAMLTLFGRPDARFFDAYPVEPNWRERRPIHQPWPGVRRTWWRPRRPGWARSRVWRRTSPASLAW